MRWRRNQRARDDIDDADDHCDVDNDGSGEKVAMMRMEDEG